MYKKISTNEWYWEEENTYTRKLLLDKKYDFSVTIDIVELSSEADAFLKMMRLLSYLIRS